MLILARHAHGHDMRGLPDSTAAAPLSIDVAEFDYFVCFAFGWTPRLAQKAAIRVREAAQLAGPSLETDALGLALSIRTVSGGRVVLTDGADRFIAVDDDQRWRVREAGARGRYSVGQVETAVPPGYSFVLFVLPVSTGEMPSLGRLDSPPVRRSRTPSCPVAECSRSRTQPLSQLRSW